VAIDKLLSAVHCPHRHRGKGILTPVFGRGALLPASGWQESLLLQLAEAGLAPTRKQLLPGLNWTHYGGTKNR